MLSRVAAVKAPRTHNRRRVAGSSGRRKAGRESEPQRPNMSRHHFYFAVLLFLVVMCCGTGAVNAEELSEPNFEWKSITDGVTVESLGVPGLLKVGNDVFAVFEAQCKNGDANTFTGIASQIITKEAARKLEEVLKETKDKTQLLEEVASSSSRKKVDVSRPTAVVKESDIYMLVGKYSRNAAAVGQVGAADGWGLLLVKGEVSDAGESKKIDWKDTKRLQWKPLGGTNDSLTELIGGGGSGVKLTDDTLLFPVEATKNDKKTKIFLLVIDPRDIPNWTLSEMSADDCSDPSVVEWKDKKLIMMTACDDGRRRVYESGDKGDLWTEALGTLSRVWGNKQDEKVKLVRSGFTTARIEGRDVVLVTLPGYSNEKGNKKGKLHLWLTDNTHIVDIGPVSGEGDDAAASSLLYKSAEGEDKKEELIALYEKKDEAEASLGMVSVLLTEQLQRVKDVLTAWKEVDDLVSKLCPSENVESISPENACSPTFKITDGLVGFLSGNFSDKTWRDEYLGVNATVKGNDGGATKTSDGVKFHGAWAEWPVGAQGENRLYHFANYNFTLVATVSIDGVPEGDTPIPLMGVKMNGAGKNTVLLGLSYSNKNKWQLRCGDERRTEHSSSWKPETTHQVAIVLQNSTQGTAYVDGQRVGGDAPCTLGSTESQEISHFYIGGDGGSAGSREGVSVTVTNVLLYNRPLSSAEMTALKMKSVNIPKLDHAKTEPRGTASTPAGQQPSEWGHLVGSSKDASGGVEGADSQVREVNATALSSNLGNVSQENKIDAGTMRESGLLPSLLLLLLGLWGFAAL
ncbi:putative trans-sialidase, Group V [Trypanosoma cruzi]|nr:putative trans-sialidase, Group V [Trypanosoma cruzi]